MAQKHLTIREAKNEVESLANELDIYVTKKNINLLKTQPRAMQIKDIVVDSSHNPTFDSFLNYVVRDEEYDTKIYGLLASIYSYKSYIAKEMQRLAEYDEIGYIRYLKEDERKTWKEIDKILHHGEGYSRVKYSRWKNDKKVVVNSN